ncbi:MAG: flavin reductase family protein [Phycisphaeraceae bacterium]
MLLDFTTLPARDRYKLLVSTVVPRPIALVTSHDDAGRVNAAPFSFFNAMGADPPLIALGVGDRRGEPKDTADNIRNHQRFVINLVSEAIAEPMNVTAIDFPADVDELAEAGLTPVPMADGWPPRIAESPVAMQCVEASTTHIGRNRVILGEVVAMHVDDALIDMDKLHIRTDALHLVGRMHGAGHYVRTSDLFELPRIRVEDWRLSR